MTTFRVLVHGKGMIVRRWFVFRRTLDLYATRFVEADDPQSAGECALRELRGEARLAVAALRPPTLIVEEVEAVEAVSRPVQEPGIVFYPAESRAHIAVRAT